MPESRSFVQEKILKALETGPMTVSEMREIVFARHRKVSEITEALTQLTFDNEVCEAPRGEQSAWYLGHSESECTAEETAIPVNPEPVRISNAAETHEYTDNSWKIDIKKTTIQTLDDLVAKCAIDLTVWLVKKCRITKWDMGSVPRVIGSTVKGWARPDATPTALELFSVSAELEKRQNIIAAKAEIQALKEDAKLLIVTAPYINLLPRNASGNMLTISTPDLHLGKLAWSKETGWADYDSRIARDCGVTAVEELIARSSHYKYDCVTFIVGNDLFNADNKMQTTTRGTPQGGDSRYHKTFRMGREMISDQISRFRAIAGEVRVFIVPGNHDELTTWQLGDSLECLFHNAPDVTIFNAPTSRKYNQWGTNMAMMCHGHEGKRADYPLLMAREQPRMWAACRFRECYTGHLHQEGMFEKMGVKVRTLSSLTAEDEWHARMAYIGNMRSAEGFMHHLTLGYMGTVVYTLPQDEECALAA